MIIKLSNSVSVRLLRAVFSWYLFVAILVTATHVYFEYAHVKKGVLTELSDIAKSFEDGLGVALWNFDEKSTDSILVGINRIGVISGVKVTDLKDEIKGFKGNIEKQGITASSIGKFDLNGHNFREVRLGSQGSFYEYKHPLPFAEKKIEITGFVYLYADKNLVLERIRDSVIMILINASIKTFALWVIFLIISRKLLERPLSDLIRATQNLANSEQHQSEMLNRLQIMSESSNRDELQQLANSFVGMQRVVLEKIDNLHVLNQFALALTQAQTKDEVYAQIMHLLQQHFGTQWGVEFDQNDAISWSTLTPDQQSQQTKTSMLPVFYADAISGNRELTYQHLVAVNEDKSLREMGSYTAFLYLPLFGSSDQPRALWCFGALHNSRLDVENKLTKESHSFLQVVINITSDTLTNLMQRLIIQEQNTFLEQRVAARTKELASLNVEFQHMALHDPLTKLPNRTLFHDRLDHLIKVAAREKKRFAVASIDLTKFKTINDTYGHDAGDTVLVEVSKRFANSLRSSDTIARMGGDEFAAILDGDCRGAEIEIVVKRLSDALEKEITLSDESCVISNANIGIALFPDHAESGDLLLKFADIAMYQAKRTNQDFVIFNQEQNLRETSQLQLMYEFEQGIEKEQLQLHYQPIIDLKTLKPVNLEALVRWLHPEQGLIFPDKFIPFAESTSLIRPLTKWVVTTACKQCAQWHRDGIMVGVAVNISTRMFNSPNLPQMLDEIVTTYQLEHRWVTLEITESAAMDRPDQAQATLKELSAMGFLISIDDFGTGHSSLSYLTCLPVAELKIDRSFVIARAEHNGVVIKTIINLAHALKLHVVAEGIEDEETLQTLTVEGCDFAQGYYICRPAQISTIDTWLKAKLGLNNPT